MNSIHILCFQRGLKFTCPLQFVEIIGHNCRGPCLNSISSLNRSHDETYKYFQMLDGMEISVFLEISKDSH